MPLQLNGAEPTGSVTPQSQVPPMQVRFGSQSSVVSHAPPCGEGWQIAPRQDWDRHSLELEHDCPAPSRPPELELDDELELDEELELELDDDLELVPPELDDAVALDEVDAAAAELAALDAIAATVAVDADPPSVPELVEALDVPVPDVDAEAEPVEVDAVEVDSEWVPSEVEVELDEEWEPELDPVLVEWLSPEEVVAAPKLEPEEVLDVGWEEPEVAVALDALAVARELVDADPEAPLLLAQTPLWQEKPLAQSLSEEQA